MTDLRNATWRKSSRSSGQTACVEVGFTRDAIGVRDTKDRQAGHIATSTGQWSTFINAIKTGRFDG